MKLVVEQGKQAGQEFRLSRPTVLLGRDPDSDIALTEQGVSRHHARLEQSPQGWTVIDLGATNGTFVNGRRIPPHKPIPIQPGDRLSISNTVLALQEVSQPVQPALRAQRHPLVSVAAAALFLLVLAAMVTLLVIVLQPEEPTAPTPTQGNPVEQLMTVVPVPTQLEGVLPSVVPLIPTELHIFPSAPTETPSPLVIRPEGEGGRAQSGQARSRTKGGN